MGSHRARGLGALLAGTLVFGGVGVASVIAGSLPASAAVDTFLGFTLPSNCSPSSGTVTCTFNYTGAADSFTVPAGVTQVTIDAKGAQGGGAFVHGGNGAEVSGTLPVTSGSTLNVVVGGSPGVGTDDGNFFGGGGGGSFVYTSADSAGLLIAAAGGGGEGIENPGLPGSSTQTATAGENSGGGAAGSAGGGGAAGVFTDSVSGQVSLVGGGGGAGAFGDGGSNPFAGGGADLANGAAGGASLDGGPIEDGGFGGGGAGSGTADFGGGGGGYNGGGGGGGVDSGSGGGGGSFIAPTAISTNGVDGDNTGNGVVTITYTVCAVGLQAHVLSATSTQGTFTGLFCVNANGVGTYTQGTVSGIGTVTTVKGTTVVAALGKNLALAGTTNGTKSAFVELAPAPVKAGTFTLR